MVQCRTQRVALGCEPLEFGTGLVEHAADIVARGRQRVLRLAEIVYWKEIRGLDRLLAVAQSARSAHLRGEHQKVAARLEQYPTDVRSCGRDDPACFVVGGSKDLFPHPREVSRLFTPGVALGPVVVNQRGNPAYRFGASRPGLLLVLRVISMVHFRRG